MAILQDVSQEAIQSIDEVLAEIAKLRAENEKLKAQPQRGLSMKVSDKGALSIYGMGRFPVTLYRGQWERLAKAMPEVLAFIEANVGKLTVKA